MIELLSASVSYYIITDQFPLLNPYITDNLEGVTPHTLNPTIVGISIQSLPVTHTDCLLYPSL